MELFPDNWSVIFAPETPLLELIVRGTVLYFAILILVRVMPRRTGGELATMDLVFVLLIAEAAAHALGGYSAVADGLIVIATLMGWNYLLNFLSFYSPTIERLVSAQPLQIVRNGRLLRRNMRKEFLTEEELMERLRQDGVENIADIKAAYVESEGNISIIKKRTQTGATGSKD
ncbi:MAG TPA: YetF domain-containing protein [Burkholderiales bacterium]|nr:YetF domain-containing protein [Burkholderiales bacterium]